ncbi:MAG: VCBS repeat-containing protein [Bacillota bacterium]
MKIAGANVALRSAHSLKSENTLVENLNVWSGGRRSSGGRQSGWPSFTVDTGSSRRSFQTYSASHLSRMKSADDADRTMDVKIRLLEELFYLTTGKRIRLSNPSVDLSGDMGSSEGTGLNIQVTANQGWGISYDRMQVYAEEEQMNFAASGTVQTEDGRSISFDMQLLMQRSYYESSGMSLRIGDAAQPSVDPLAINLGGGAIGLTQNKFAFDLDGDGSKENVSFIAGQGGFLALDKNGDGTINNGSELFGPQSGDGFKDLSAYDLDKNGWIDENDPVFGKLKIFNMTEDGKTVLMSFGEAGVGALCLKNIDTEFSFKQGREEQGQMRKSSVFLKEDGTAGMLHHIDLAL